MSPIGRIFVVINLVLSAAFLGFAANNLASAQKYRTQFDQKVAELSRVERSLGDQIGQLDARVQEEVRMRTDVKNVKDRLESDKTALEQELAATKDELGTFKTSMSNIDSQLGDMTSRLEDMASKVAEAQTNMRDAIEAKRDAQAAQTAAETENAGLKDTVNQLRSDVATLERNLNTETNRASDLDTALKTLQAQTGVSLAGVKAVPKIDGAVLQYDSELKLVHINRGQNDQVERGFVFDIFANGIYKGQARVEVVNPGTCTAFVTSSISGTQIRQGDRVSTQI
ncbi:MAG: hypothetical protein AAGA20_17550 [Planctomycetota bacterium]